MEGLYSYIVKVEDRYNNKVAVDNKELIVNTEISVNDHIFVNRIGTLSGVPSGYPSTLRKEDEVLVHHNVFRRWHNIRGEEKNCRSYIHNKLYSVQADQIFAYKRNGSWRALPDYTFLKPIVNDSQWDNRSHCIRRGEVLYSEEFEKESTVGFIEGMNVEITLEGEKLYRVLNKFIYGQFES